MRKEWLKPAPRVNSGGLRGQAGQERIEPNSECHKGRSHFTDEGVESCSLPQMELVFAWMEVIRDSPALPSPVPP